MEIADCSSHLEIFHNLGFRDENVRVFNCHLDQKGVFAFSFLEFNYAMQLRIYNFSSKIRKRSIIYCHYKGVGHKIALLM